MEIRRGSSLSPSERAEIRGRTGMRLDGQDQGFHGIRSRLFRFRLMHAGMFRLECRHILLMMIVHPYVLRSHGSGFEHAPQQGSSHFAKSDNACFHR